MRRGLVIARASYRELFRERLVLGIGAVGIFLVAVSLLLGEITIDERERLIADFSLFTGEVAAVALACLMGAWALPREIERQTCLLVLARPVSRFEFLLGKWLGFAAMQGVMIGVIALTTGLLIGWFPVSLAAVALSLWLKSLVVLSWAMAASNVMRPALAALCGLVLYLLGHWLGDLEFFARESGSSAFLLLAQGLRWTVPGFDLYNWKSYFHLVHAPGVRDIIGMTMQTLAWAGLGLAAAAAAFRRRDIV